MSIKLLLLFTTLVINVQALVSLSTEEKNMQFLGSKALTFREIRLEKINNYQAKLFKRMNEVKSNLLNHLEDELQLTPEEIQEELDDEKVLETYELIITELQYIQKVISEYQKYQTNFSEKELHTRLRKVIEIDYALKTSGIKLLQHKLPEYTRELFRDHKIEKYSDVDIEATNLYDPEKKRMINKDELNEMIKKNVDLSLYDPAPKSPFWYDLDIKNKSIEKLFQDGKSPMYKGLDVWFPKKKARFKKVKKSQTKPKFHVTAKHKGEKIKFKLKMAEETQSEVTASALSAALGFHHDISKHVTDFKVELPKKMSVEEVKTEWNSYYSKYDFDKYVKEIYQDDDRTVIVIKEGLLEIKPEDLIRVGPWAYSYYDHRSLRELRGLYIFNAWIANNDIKEADNNKLVIRYDKKNTDQYQLFQFQHDQGFSFGKNGKEKIQEFQWDLVKKTSDKAVHIINNNLQTNSGFNHVTYYDSKWMVRKIANLSREQITEAVKLGGWPDEVAELLVEKLISRRNQLVSAFELEDQYQLLEYDRYISTENGVLDNGSLTTFEFSNYLKRYGGEFRDFMKPILEKAQYYAARGAIELTSSFDTFVIDSQELGYDTKVLGQVQVTLNRRITENENKQDIDDNFIVQDRVRLKFSIGAGIVIRGKVSYYKDYRILYTARTRKEAVFKNNFIFNALLPFDKRNNKLPNDYVMIVEDGFEGEGELFLSAQKIPISASVSKGLGLMSRTVFHKKNSEYEVFRDFSHFNSFHAAIYANLYILRIPVFQADLYNGNLVRNIYKFKIEDEETPSNEMMAYEYLLKTGDLVPLSEVANQETIETNYVSKRGFFDFFGFLRNDNRYRTDEVLYSHDDDEDNYFQVNIEQIREWKFISDGETKNRKFHLLAKINQDTNQVEDVDLRVNFNISDRNTKMKELTELYLPLVNRVALNKSFINFSPQLHSTNDTWGHMHINLDLGYPKETLDKIINIQEDDFFEVMANSSNRDAEFWRSRRSDDVENKINYLRGKIKSFLSELKKIRKVDDDKKRYERLTKAIKKSIWKSGGGFNTTILERVHYMLGAENYYIKGVFTMPDFVEMRLPADVPLNNRRNVHLYQSHSEFIFDYYEPKEIWYMFQRP